MDFGLVLRRPIESTAETGEVESCQNHMYDKPTLQELVDKSFQIKKSSWTSSWH